MSPDEQAPLDWTRDGPQWPHHAHSRFVRAAGLNWHVQQFGSGAPVLLVHGTGASTHSWRALAPLLARRYAITSCDLPGHGFTTGMPARGLSLTGMSEALAALLLALEVRPQLVIGHSAGAAIGCRMTLDGYLTARAVVSINGALLPLHPLQRMLFSPFARLLASSALPARIIARLARDPAAVDRLLAGTGSQLDADDVELYRRLVRTPAHVGGALRMMAQWELDQLERDLVRLPVPLILIVALADRMVPPSQALQVQRLLPQATVIRLPGLGHLAHEERADVVAEAVLSCTDTLLRNDARTR